MFEYVESIHKKILFLDAHGSQWGGSPPPASKLISLFCWHQSTKYCLYFVSSSHLMRLTMAESSEYFCRWWCEELIYKYAVLTGKRKGVSTIPCGAHVLQTRACVLINYGTASEVLQYPLGHVVSTPDKSS